MTGQILPNGQLTLAHKPHFGQPCTRESETFSPPSTPGRALLFSSAEWIGYLNDITTVGQCSWLIPGKGEYIHPGVKSIGCPDNLCQHLLFEFCSALTFNSLSLKFQTSLNKNSFLHQPCYKSKHFFLHFFYHFKQYATFYLETASFLPVMSSSCFVSQVYTLALVAHLDEMCSLYFEVCSPRLSKLSVELSQALKAKSG